MTNSSERANPGSDRIGLPGTDNDPLITITVVRPVQPKTLRLNLYVRGAIRPPNPASRYMRTLVALAALGGRARGEEIASLVDGQTHARNVHADMQTIRRQFGEEIVPRYNGDLYTLGRVECVWAEVERGLGGERDPTILVGAEGHCLFMEMPVHHPLALHLDQMISRMSLLIAHAVSAPGSAPQVVDGMIYPPARHRIGMWVGSSPESNQGAGSARDGHRWPLRVLIMTRDSAAAARLARALAEYGSMVETVVIEEASIAVERISTRRFGGIYMDPFTVDNAIDLIAWIRDRHREVGVVLYGRWNELFELSNIPEMWRQTLKHFWRLPKDATDESFQVTLEDTIILLLIYWQSEGRFGERPTATAKAMFTEMTSANWNW